MQRTLIATAAAAAFLTLAGTAQAQTNDLNTYVEVGYSRVSVKASDFGLKASPSVLSTTLGRRINANLAIEANLGLALGSDELTFNGAPTGVKAKLGTNLGVFLRPSVQLNDSVEFFGRAGWQRTRLKLSADGASDSASDNDFAYGFGVNYSLSKTSYLQASWLNQLSKGGVNAKAIGLSYGYRF